MKAASSSSPPLPHVRVSLVRIYFSWRKFSFQDNFNTIESVKGQRKLPKTDQQVIEREREREREREKKKTKK